jgi:hypothetical protein
MVDAAGVSTAPSDPLNAALPRAPSMPPRRRLRAIAIAMGLGAAGAGAGFACGGTTGREDLPMPGADASATLDGGTDVTAADDANLDATTFDVPIVYADRQLPDVGPPKEAGGDGDVYPWPNCPPWVPVQCEGPSPIPPEACRGTPAPLGSELIQEPAQYDDAGNVLVDDAGIVVLFPPDSGCGNYGWLGSVATDECTANNYTPAEDYPILPPCNWCADAGVAIAGSGAGRPRYDLCLELYQCMMHTQCATRYPANCLCGAGSLVNNCDAGGPCATEEMAALEIMPDPEAIQRVIMDCYSSSRHTCAGFCGAALNNLFTGATAGQPVGLCFLLDAGE